MTPRTRHIVAAIAALSIAVLGYFFLEENPTQFPYFSSLVAQKDLTLDTFYRMGKDGGWRVQINGAEVTDIDDLMKTGKLAVLITQTQYIEIAKLTKEEPAPYLTVSKSSGTGSGLINLGVTVPVYKKWCRDIPLTSNELADQIARSVLQSGLLPPN